MWCLVERGSTRTAPGLVSSRARLLAGAAPRHGPRPGTGRTHIDRASCRGARARRRLSHFISTFRLSPLSGPRARRNTALLDGYLSTHERTYRAAWKSSPAIERTSSVCGMSRTTPAHTSRHINMLRAHAKAGITTRFSSPLSSAGRADTQQPAVYILINTPSLLVLIFLPPSRATTARSNAFCR